MKGVDSDKRNAILRRLFPTSLRKSTVRGSGRYDETGPGQWGSLLISEWLTGYGLGYQIYIETHFPPVDR